MDVSFVGAAVVVAGASVKWTFVILSVDHVNGKIGRDSHFLHDVSHDMLDAGGFNGGGGSLGLKEVIDGSVSGAEGASEFTNIR